MGNGDLDLGSMVLYFECCNFVEGVSASLIGHKLAGFAHLVKLGGVFDFTKAFAVRKAL